MTLHKMSLCLIVFSVDLQLFHCDHILSSHQSLYLDASGRDQPLLEDGESLYNRQEIYDLSNARMGYLTPKFTFCWVFEVNMEEKL